MQHVGHMDDQGWDYDDDDDDDDQGRGGYFFLPRGGGSTYSLFQSKCSPCGSFIGTSASKLAI